ncbi:MAG: type II secretion system protein F [Gemmatimonadota bacterium]|nr:MAG: type II secretion system protein F [Gemmatimonadota bacterium]
MTTYVWRGRTSGGEVVSGELTVTNRSELLSQLRKKRIIVTSVKQKPKEISFKMPGGGGIGTKDLAIFTRQFATMINAGLPLVQCLDILSRQLSKEHFRDITKKVMNDIEAGATLSESFRKHPKAFDELYVNMVSAGEAGGILDTILLRLADYIEKIEALKRKVKSALMYPAVVLVVALGATLFMLMFIIPTFARMFSDFGAELPLPTKVVLGASNFIRGYWWALLAGTAGFLFGLKKYYATDGGHHRIDGLMLKMPVLGDVLRKGAVARFTRTLGTLVSSGVPILDGLEITAKTAGNVIVQDAVMMARTSIREGDTISNPLRQSGVFPPMVVQMITVGEETGALDEMLTKIADFYDEEVDSAVDALTSIIEPVMIVFMGAIVGGMVVAMYLPIFQMVNVIAG